MHQRQLNVDGQATEGRRSGFDVSAMRSDDALADGEPEARAAVRATTGFLGAIERFEQLAEFVGRHARAAVGDDQLRIASHAPRGDFQAAGGDRLARRSLKQVFEQLQDAMMTGTRDTYKLQQIMRRTLGSWVARQLHRKPMIVPVVADIAQDVDEAMGLNAAQ